MLSKLTSLVLLSICFILCSTLICTPAYSGTIGVTISDPGSRCAEEGAYNVGNICTHDSVISLSGSAGLHAILTGSSVISANFRSNVPLKEDDICINITTAADWARLDGTVDIARDLSEAYIVINGVNIFGGANAAATLSNINSRTGDTGVIASLGERNVLVLTQAKCGSDYRIYVSYGEALFGPSSAAAIGRDVQAVVQYKDGFNVTDAIWAFGTSCVIRDSLGNAIYLTEEAASVAHDLGPQIRVNYQYVSRITWRNASNGATGECTAASYWTADNIPLAKGENIIIVTAENNAGDSGNAVISVDRYDLPVTITSPITTQEPYYYTRTSTIDVSGTSELRDTPALIAVPVGADVISADLSHCALTEGEEISIVTTQAASYACLTGTVAINADMSANIIAINGVSIPGGINESGTLYNINSLCEPMGIHASVDMEHHLVLRSCICGSASVIAITGGTNIFGPACAAGTGMDAIARVTDSTGADISDALWDKGTGTILRDSLGNTIKLQEVSTSIPCYLGVQFSMQFSPSAVVTWRNDTTGAQGTCSGVKNWSAANIPLDEGYNRIIITGSDESGMLGKAEIYPFYFVPCSSISAAMKDGHNCIALTDQIVTWGTSEAGDCFYVEDANRTSGIPVFFYAAEQGDKVTVDGILWSELHGDGFVEHVIGALRVTKEGSGMVRPLGIANKALVESDDNVRLTGLLVRTWGKVKHIYDSPNFLIIQDGSGSELICQLPDSMTANPTWNFVSVTGIASRCWSGDRVIRVRNANDVVPY